MTRKQMLLAFVLLLAALSVSGAALAQTSPNFDLEWHVVAGGGQPVSSANYVVHSTIGQALGASSLSSANFRLSGGFWPVSGGRYATIYLPLVLKNWP
ncbi:MAG: hypothetical protein ACP5J4_17000 [Anaerolineae bacterium]